MVARPDTYVPAPVVTVQCPRCGQHQDIRQVGVSTGVGVFSGVCGTPIPDAGFCSTTLRLSAAAHVFASPPA